MTTTVFILDDRAVPHPRRVIPAPAATSFSRESDIWGQLVDSPVAEILSRPHRRAKLPNGEPGGGGGGGALLIGQISP